MRERRCDALPRRPQKIWPCDALLRMLIMHASPDTVRHTSLRMWHAAQQHRVTSAARAVSYRATAQGICSDKHMQTCNSAKVQPHSGTSQCTCQARAC